MRIASMSTRKVAPPCTLLALSQVSVDGTVQLEPKYQVVPGVEMVTCGTEAVPTGDHVFCLMHKPAGYVCQRHPHDRNVYELIPEELQRPDLSACGRLDRDTTGILLFTTDGGIQSLLLFPTSRVWKTYTAVLERACSELLPQACALFERGMVLDDGLRCAPAALEILDTATVRVRVHEGHFHQVKRMLAHVGGTVKELHRDAFGGLTDPELPIGSMRSLTAGERSMLLDMLPLDRVAAREMTGRMEQSRPNGVDEIRASETLPAGREHCHRLDLEPGAEAKRRKAGQCREPEPEKLA